jgi:hypothetical protein
MKANERAAIIGLRPTDRYSYFSKKADSLYKVQEYKNAALTYSKAFQSLGWKGLPVHRYNAACAWALAGFADSAFFQLHNIATKANYTNYVQIMGDPALASLHRDKRWNPLLGIIKQNKEKADAAEAKLNKPLIAQLDTIFKDDQKYRIQMDTIITKYGWESPQMQAHIELMKRIDSINLVKVKNIIDRYGWLGSDVVGGTGNLTLFLVIQHADLTTQEKYLPVMREAVKKGNARAENLALLEDRVALRRGKRQTYGSQVDLDKETNLYYVLPLNDPDNVDVRRASVGLGPLAEYVKQWQIRWDVDQYKKDLPKIEAKEKAKTK